MAARWYVIHVYSGFEKKVAQSIREQAEQKSVAEKFEEVLVPTEEVVEVKRGAKVSSERKFFPGYVLVKMDLTDETWHLVKNTPKVTGFLGGKGRPVPISETEATRIMRQVQEGIELRPGDACRARILAGREGLRIRSWRRRSSVSSSCKCRRARRTRRRRSARPWVSAGSTSWSSARRSTRRPRGWSRACRSR